MSGAAWLLLLLALGGRNNKPGGTTGVATVRPLAPCQRGLPYRITVGRESGHAHTFVTTLTPTQLQNWADTPGDPTWVVGMSAMTGSQAGRHAHPVRITRAQARTLLTSGALTVTSDTGVGSWSESGDPMEAVTTQHPHRHMVRIACQR